MQQRDDFLEPAFVRLQSQDRFLGVVALRLAFVELPVSTTTDITAFTHNHRTAVGLFGMQHIKDLGVSLDSIIVQMTRCAELGAPQMVPTQSALSPHQLRSMRTIAPWYYRHVAASGSSAAAGEVPLQRYYRQVAANDPSAAAGDVPLQPLRRHNVVAAGSAQ